MKVHPEKRNEIVPPVSKSESAVTYECYLCDKQFASKRNLKRHKQIIHGEAPQKKFKCTLCTFEAETKKCWLDHFQSGHQINVKEEELEFTSEEEFFKWKEDMERVTLSKFIKNRGTKLVGDTATHYFDCHRSGQFISKSKGKRNLKLTGSNKVNGKCPAGMKVVVNGGKCRVNFLSTHVGHNLDLSHLPLAEQDRESIAAYIELGVPFPAILDKIRRTVRDSNLERVHLTTMQDLHNIAAAYNIGSGAVRHRNDALSVEAWVQDVNQSENPCVLFYKPQDTTSDLHPELKREDFVLIIMNSAQAKLLGKYGSDCICVDGTHGLNGYDFEVNTLLVLDDVRQGFPCAFLISNRSDSDVLSIFFNYVKSQVGPISPKVFMTDLAESYITAWARTMGTPEMRLFCSWHVLRAWQTNIVNKIKHEEKRKEVNNLLSALMRETDVSVFEKSFHKSLQKLHHDPATREFGTYFKSYYGKNVKCWAYCHRLQAGLNTNMHLESMHKALKYLDGNTKQVKRLDKGISAMMSFVTAKLFDRLIVNIKGKVTSKMKDIRRRHKDGISKNKQFIITKVGSSWEVLSLKSQEVYVVREKNAQCKCKLVCSDCKCCIHRYCCTCIDYSIKLNMCKHIHNVCQGEMGVEILSQNLDDSDNELVDDGGVNVINEQEAILNVVSVHSDSNTTGSLSDERRNLVSAFADIVETMSATDIQLGKKVIKSLKATMSAAQVRNGSAFRTEGRSQKRRLVPQRRLYSTKKKRLSRHRRMVAPDAQECRDILRDVLDEGTANEMLEEIGPLQCQQECKHSTQGPVSVCVEENLALHQEHQHILPGVDMKNSAALMDHNYALPYHSI